MEASDDDIELISLTDSQARQFARIGQLWPEFGHALQVLAASEGGGMGWKTVDGVEYLTRYFQEDGKKKGRSLGRRSPETEAWFEEFDSTVLKARRIRREYREDVLLTCKLAKAYGIARLHGRFAHTLDWLWYTNANKRVALFGGSALLAYRHKRDFYLPELQKARVHAGTSYISDLPDAEQKKILWKQEWCLVALRMKHEKKITFGDDSLEGFSAAHKNAEIPAGQGPAGHRRGGLEKDQARRRRRETEEGRARAHRKGRAQPQAPAGVVQRPRRRQHESARAPRHDPQQRQS